MLAFFAFCLVIWYQMPEDPQPDFFGPTPLLWVYLRFHDSFVKKIGGLPGFWGVMAGFMTGFWLHALFKTKET